MPIIKPVIVLLATFWLSACAHTEPAATFEDEFATDISANGTKFFTYTRHFQKGSNAQGRHRSDKDADTALNKSVQEKLDTSGYCRDGYLTLEDYEANGVARIRGECRDGATDNDRTLFQNQR